MALFAPKPVAGYDRRVPIWGATVPGNHPGSKLERMRINHHTTTTLATMAFFMGTATDDEARERDCDTFTYLTEIKPGYERETFEDEPYLVPYVARDAEGAPSPVGCILVPGGGFGNKSMDGDVNEGEEPALALVERGVSAFVLHYRSNPYEYPVPYLDFQRAVRYLRAHAEDYGLDPARLSAVGFSAGGNVVCTHVNLISGRDLLPEGYERDAVDAEDDRLPQAAMCYPAVNFCGGGAGMLFCMFDAGEVRDPVRRAELVDQMDTIAHFDSADVRQFLSYGTADQVVGTEQILAYVARAREAGCDLTVHVAEGQNHAYHAPVYADALAEWLLA